jgi:CysZ protein
VEVNSDVVERKTTAASDFLTGLRILGRGFGTYARSPRFLLLGMIPAFIALILVAGAMLVLLFFIKDIAAGVTWFADDWSSGWRSTIRVFAGVAIVLVAIMVAVLTYTALTLLIGDPFYEVISKKVEERLGGTPGEIELPWYRTFRRNAIDSVRLIALGIAVSIPLFLLGFVPVLGQTVVPVIDAIVGGWLLAVELTGIPFNRRGLYLTQRRRLLRANRPLALGFGIPVFLLLLIPFAAVLVVPAAVAGSTLLARQVLGQGTEPRGTEPQGTEPRGTEPRDAVPQDAT